MSGTSKLRISLFILSCLVSSVALPSTVSAKFEPTKNVKTVDEDAGMSLCAPIAVDSKSMTPELSCLVILPLFLIAFSITATVRHRKSISRKSDLAFSDKLNEESNAKCNTRNKDDER